MKYRYLGKSGLLVSRISLGTMTFGTEWGWGADKDESRRIFETFAEAGGNFLDTANYYTGGESEQLLGEFMAPHRERVVLARQLTLLRNIRNSLDHEPSVEVGRRHAPYLVTSGGEPLPNARVWIWGDPWGKVYEAYTDEAAFQAHLEMEHTRRWQEVCVPLLDRSSIRMPESVSAWRS